MPITNRPIHVLLVEDNREHSELLARLLAASEYPQFSVASEGTLSAGIARIADRVPDIVLLDLSLPDSAGVDTFRRMNAAAPAVPIVILSGAADVTSSIEMVQEGAQDYLVKGHVDTHLLLRSIQYAIERKGSQSAAERLNTELEARVRERTSALEAANVRLEREIGERKHAEEQLVKSNRQLTVAVAELRAVQRSRATSDRSGAATREIEEAFKRIHRHSELILRAPAVLSNPEKVAEHLGQIVAAADEGRKALRKPHEGGDAPAREGGTPLSASEAVALDGLAERVIALCTPGAAEQADSAASKVSFVQKTEKGVTIQGDPELLCEMLTHLVRNSMSAIPRRGTITVGARQEGNAAILSVRDDGLGVTEAMRQRLLDPSAVAVRAEGGPSGYALIHEVVARHGGRLEIESRKGIGSTVRVIFPSAGSAGAPARLRRVLVVDDDPIIREVLSTYLSEDGYSVELAENGREALEKFCAGQFDIVLTDRSMPDMGGDELAREVKKKNPAVPVILLTGFGDIMTAAGEKPEGVDVVMNKPFTMAGLQNTLARFR